MLTIWLVICAVILAGLIAAAVVAVLQLNQGGAYLARHHARSRAKRSLPHEMRHHRTTTGTWARTRGARAARLSGEATVVLDQTSPPHTLADRDKAGQQWRVTNLLDHTGEITSANLEAILGPRPAELIGASA